MDTSFWFKMNNAKKNNTNKIDGDRNKVYEFLFINDKNT